MSEIMEKEKYLEDAGLTISKKAYDLVITNQAEYEEAALMLTEIKTRMKEVKSYWEEPKKAAAAAHKNICNKETEMLKPLTSAETLLKSGMVKYQKMVEEQRRKEEEEARRRQQEEQERLLAEAIKAEESGDKLAAEIGMAMAETVGDIKPVIETEKPKADGIGVRKEWKARIVDATKVPAYINGVEVRPINQSALNAIAKMTKGSLTAIPGIEWYEETSITARAF